MCSIAGIKTPKEEEKSVMQMLASMHHRAPDEENVFKDAHLQLGMGRLKIIDLYSTNLCLWQENDLVLAYNGEIYNYPELREKLKKYGHVFTTESDIEVLVKCWREWGTKMFDELNGMFAFALYDISEKKLYLARDIAGEKPLYYYQKGKTFAFASEAKAFVGQLPLTKQKNKFFESFQHCFGKTLWEEVDEVPPAHYLVYDIENCTKKLYEYWKLTPRYINPHTAEEELEFLLEDAIRIRTRSDVPYGLYYSEGIDSALISTFHDFEKKFYFDDSEDWKEDFFNTIDKIVWHLDFPVGSLSSYPLWKLAERAQQSVKVILSGEGADEIFGGYTRYLPIAREQELRKAYPSYSPYLFNKYFVNSYLDSYTNITVRNEDKAFVREQLKPYFDMFDDPVTAMGYADFKLVMPSLLQMGDRMAGAFGIENRCPFLDKRVIEFGFNLPPELKIQGLEQKVLLRRLLKNRGLIEPLSIEKKGLTIKFNRWFEKKDWDRSKYFNLLKEQWGKQFGDQNS